MHHPPFQCLSILPDSANIDLNLSRDRIKFENFTLFFVKKPSKWGHVCRVSSYPGKYDTLKRSWCSCLLKILVGSWCWWSSICFFFPMASLLSSFISLCAPFSLRELSQRRERWVWKGRSPSWGISSFIPSGSSSSCSVDPLPVSRTSVSSQFLCLFYPSTSPIISIHLLE